MDFLEIYRLIKKIHSRDEKEEEINFTFLAIMIFHKICPFFRDNEEVIDVLRPT
jgi:hypothetical protein